MTTSPTNVYPSAKESEQRGYKTWRLTASNDRVYALRYEGVAQVGEDKTTRRLCGHQHYSPKAAVACPALRSDGAS